MKDAIGRLDGLFAQRMNDTLRQFEGLLETHGYAALPMLLQVRLRFLSDLLPLVVMGSLVASTQQQLITSTGTVLQSRLLRRVHNPSMSTLINNVFVPQEGARIATMKSVLHEQVTETMKETLRNYDQSIKETMNETLRTVLNETLESRGYGAPSLSIVALWPHFPYSQSPGTYRTN